MFAVHHCANCYSKMSALLHELWPQRLHGQKETRHPLSFIVTGSPFISPVQWLTSGRTYSYHSHKHRCMSRGTLSPTFECFPPSTVSSRSPSLICKGSTWRKPTRAWGWSSGTWRSRRDEPIVLLSPHLTFLRWTGFCTECVSMTTSWRTSQLVSMLRWQRVFLLKATPRPWWRCCRPTSDPPQTEQVTDITGARTFK